MIELFALRSADSPENPVMTAHGLHGGCIIAGIYMGSAYVSATSDERQTEFKRRTLSVAFRPF